MPEQTRAADRDRERTLDELRGHAAEGRLDLAELEERSAAALRARTLADLAELTRDLPGKPRSRKPARPSREPLLRLALLAALLVGIWAVTGGGYFWPAWPILGVGMCSFAPFACQRGARTL